VTAAEDRLRIDRGVSRYKAIRSAWARPVLRGHTVISFGVWARRPRPTERGSVAEDHSNREQKSDCPHNPSLPAQPGRVEPYAPPNRSFQPRLDGYSPRQNWRTAMTDAVPAETPCFAQHRSRGLSHAIPPCKAATSGFCRIAGKPLSSNDNVEAIVAMPTVFQ
jgi:hypothetical protein